MCLLAGALLAGAAGTARAQNFQVTSNADTGAVGTLRWALGEANAFGGAATISLNAGLGTITLTSELPVLKNTAGITIDGNGATIDGGSTSNTTGFRVFFLGVGAGEAAVSPGLTATTNTAWSISNLTIQNANARGGNGAAGGMGAGGAIFVNAGQLSLNSVNFLNNRAVGGTGSTVFGGGGGMGGNAGIGGGGFGPGASGGGASQVGAAGGFLGAASGGSSNGGVLGGAQGGGGGGSVVGLSGHGAGGGGVGGQNGTSSGSGRGGGGGFGGGGGYGFREGGHGGYGGGGGSYGQNNSPGGNGGFGGGAFYNFFGSSAGFGGGNGHLFDPNFGIAGGGGGAGLGGAVFVRQGASVNFLSPSAFTGGVAQGGLGANGGIVAETNGQGIGSALFLAGTASYTVPTGGNVTLNDSLGSGTDSLITGGFTKEGAGTLTLTGANSGSLIVNAGTLALNRSALATGTPVLAPGSGNVTVNAGGILRFDGSNNFGAHDTATGPDVVVNGGQITNSGAYINALQNLTLNNASLAGIGGTGALGSYSVRKTLTTSGTSSIDIGTANDGAFTLSHAGTTKIVINDGTLTVNAAIRDNVGGAPGRLQVEGFQNGGTLQLNGPLTHTGGTIFFNSTVAISGANNAAALNDITASNFAGLRLDSSNVFGTPGGTTGPNVTAEAQSEVRGAGNYFNQIQNLTLNASRLTAAGGVAGSGSFSIRQTLTSRDSSLIDIPATNNGALALSAAGTTTFDVTNGFTNGFLEVRANIINDASGTPGQLIKKGVGIMSLRGAGSYTGGTEVQQGTLLIDRNAGSQAPAIAANTAVSVFGRLLLHTSNSFGDYASTASPNITVNGGSLSGNGDGNSFNTLQNLTLHGGLVDLYGSVPGYGALAIRDTLTSTGTSSIVKFGPAGNVAALALSAAGTTTFDVTDTLTIGTVEIRDNFSAVPGVVRKTGPGLLILGRPNTYTGGTTISGGVLAVNSDAALGTGGVTFNSGTLRTDAALTLARPLTIGDGLVAFINTNGNDVTASGVVSGNGGLIKQGAGVLTLTNAANNQANTRIDAGTIVVSHNSHLGGSNGPLFMAGGTLRADADYTELRAMVIQSSATATLDSGGHTHTWDGPIQGTGTLAKIGAGTLSLGGFNSYTDTTTVSAGTLRFTNPGAVATDILNNATTELAFNGGFSRNVTGTGTIIANGEVIRTGGTTADTQSWVAFNGRLFYATQANLGTGPIEINSGLLIRSASSDLTLANAVTLSGNGGGLGNRAGVLSVPNLTLPASGNVRFNDDDQSTTTLNLNGPAATLGGNFTVKVGRQNSTVGTVTLSHTLQGSGSLVKTGPGTLALGGAVNVPVSIDEGTLRGTGTITGSLSGSAGTTLAPGSETTGTLTLDGALAFAASARFGLQITDGTTPAASGTGGSTLGLLPAPTSNTFLDKLGGPVPTGLSLLSLSIDLNDTTFTLGQNYSYLIARGMGDQSGLNVTDPARFTFTETGSLSPTAASLTGNAQGLVYVNFTAAAIPEPSVSLLLCLGAAGLAMRRRARR